MRTFQPRTTSRRVCAVMTAGAMAAAGIGLLATPAYAAVAVTISPTSGPNGGGNTITVTGTSLFTTAMTAPVAAFNLGSTCPATPGGTGNIAATTTKPALSTTTATVTVPATALAVGNAPTDYIVCVYGTSNATVVQNNPVTYTVTPATLTLSPTGGVSGAGGTATATSSTEFINTSVTPGATFSVASCPATYTTTGLNYAASGVTRTSGMIASIPVPATVAAVNGVAPTYNVCVYNGTAVSSVLIGSGTYVTSIAPVTVTPTSGANGGGNTITASSTSAFLTSVTTPYVQFTTSACPAEYGASPTNPATGTKTSNSGATVPVPAGVLATSATPSVYNVCFYGGTTSGDDLIGTGATYSVVLPAATSSATTVESAGTDSLTITSTSPILSGVTTPYVVVNSAACPATYAAPAATTSYAGTVRRLSNYRLAVTLTADITTARGGGGIGTWNVCVYNGSGVGTSTLVAAPTSFRAVTPPTLDVTTPIAPAAGPAIGGTPVTITGTGFPATGTITATLGGIAMENVVRVSATSITADTPPHSAANDLTLTVNTENGSVSTSAAFDYTYGIVVSPNTANNDTGSNVDVSIQGVGFEDLDFVDTTGLGTHSTDATAHVFLVNGTYVGDDVVDNASGAASPDTKKDNPPIAECTDVLVISDKELVCNFKLNDSLDDTGTAVTTPVPDGTYTVTVVNAGDVDPTGLSTSNISSGSTFTVADY